MHSDFPVPTLVCVLADSGFEFSVYLTVWYFDPCLHSVSDSSLALIKSLFHFLCVHLGPSLSPPNHTRNRVCVHVCECVCECVCVCVSMCVCVSV